MSTLRTLLTSANPLDFLAHITGNGDSDKSTLLFNGHIHNWAKAIKKVHPERALLQTVCFADAAHILAELSDPTNDLCMHLFSDIPGMEDNEDNDYTKWSTPDYVRWLNDTNTRYTEGVPNGVYSTALQMLADYLAGETHDTRPLLFAIAGRLWRVNDGTQRLALQTAVFALYTYVFHYNGWMDNKLAGVRYAHIRYVAGESIPVCTDQEWDDGCWDVDQVGSLPFGLHKPVTEEFLEERDIFQHDTWDVAVGDDRFTLVDYGNHGVGLLGKAGDVTLVYFLRFPPAYDPIISAAFTINTYGDDYLKGCNDDDEDEYDEEEEVENLYHDIWEATHQYFEENE